MSREIYHSSTMGNIPLSFTGRHLLQQLRVEIQDLMKKVYNNGYDDGITNARKFPAPGSDWEPVSRARARLAQYMSDLEEKRRVAINLQGLHPDMPPPEELRRYTDSELVKEITRRGLNSYEVTGSLIADANSVRDNTNPQKVELPIKGDTGYTFHLPPIPDGYDLAIVNGIVAISPIQEIQADPAVSPPALALPVNEYLVKYIGDRTEPRTVNGVTTNVELMGSASVKAVSMEEALSKIVQMGKGLGYGTCPADWSVQLVRTHIDEEDEPI